MGSSERGGALFYNLWWEEGEEGQVEGGERKGVGYFM